MSAEVQLTRSLSIISRQAAYNPLTTTKEGLVQMAPRRQWLLQSPAQTFARQERGAVRAAIADDSTAGELETPSAIARRLSRAHQATSVPAVCGGQLEGRTPRQGIAYQPRGHIPLLPC